jgi:hypothetical protein
MKFQVKGWDPRGESMVEEVDVETGKEAVAAGKKAGMSTVRSVSQMEGGVIEEAAPEEEDLQEAEDEQGEDPAEATDETEGGGV